ncbi:hypothetical protein EHH44_05475 [Mycolicibacter terrae]|uniref:Uncharacterized protein n=1 Tax=Mycolicibacter terrae TaxID=1788 RepID=A0ACD2ER12_9MYCO|nr:MULTISPECIES: hypothetical protein [Mycolicibacter]OBH15878.1 hypothetical protein A5694_07900 [Mycolicibacter sinensis]RRR47309.1 hypothetical protein EHH44_05475 [Mycolicibacter terrae]
MRRLVYGVLPGLILAMTAAAGWLKWYEGSIRADEAANAETIRAATEYTIRILSFTPDTIERDLAGAQQSMTAGFRAEFAARAREQIIPDAQARKVTAIAEVPGAASVWATRDHAAVLVFADRVVTVGSAEPAEVASSYRVALDKVDGRWLVADFEPV